jgi:hypothetical protein
MRFIEHSCWLFILLSVLSISFAYAELPPPRIWMSDTTHDSARKTQQIALKFNSALKKYLKTSKRLEVEDGKAKRRQDLNAEVNKAESYKYSGIEAFRNKKYDEAQKILRSSLKLYTKHVASVKEMRAIFQTLLYLAASYTMLDYGGDAKDYYRQLAAVAPKDFEMGADFSKKVLKKYQKEKKRLLKKKKGMISVTTKPAGVNVWVDGVKRCVSPCQVKNLIRGVHYVKVEKDGIGFNGSIVKVKAGWSVKMDYTVQKNLTVATKSVVDPVILKSIESDLKQAKIEAKFRQNTENIAQEQDVGYVLVTHLLKNKNKVTVFSYLYGNESKLIFALKPITFATRFSSAKITAMNLVRSIEKLVAKLPKNSQDGIHAPLLALIQQNKESQKVVATPAPVIRNMTKTPKQRTPAPTPKKVALLPLNRSKMRPSSTTQRPLIERQPTRKKSNSSLLKSPWFWGGMTVVIVGAVVTTVLLVSDSQAENTRFETEVSW